MRQRLPWVAVGLAALVLGSGIGGVTASTSEGGFSPASEPCSYSDVHNTAKIRATQHGTVTAGKHLNGTGGAVWFTGLPSHDPFGIRKVRLLGPEGTEIGPVEQIGPDVIIDEIPLCNEGTWTLKEHPSNVTLTRFRTATDPMMAGPGTVVLDRPVDRTPTPSYRAGDVFAAEHYAGCSWDGDTRLGRDLGTHPTNVYLDWSVEAPGSFEGLITLKAEGERSTYLTTKRVHDWGNGTISTIPEWRSPSVVEVSITAWAVEDQEFWTRCTETRRLAIGPFLGAITNGGLSS